MITTAAFRTDAGLTYTVVQVDFVLYLLLDTVTVTLAAPALRAVITPFLDTDADYSKDGKAYY